MKSITYLLYIIFWEVFCFGGAAYLVVWKNRSGWWIVAAFLLSAVAYSPQSWIHGKKEI